MIVAAYSVFCEDCTDWTAEARSVADARAWAKSRHWLRKRRDGAMVDLCPLCAEVPCHHCDYSECPVHRSFFIDDSPQCTALAARIGGDHRRA